VSLLGREHPLEVFRRIDWWVVLVATAIAMVGLVFIHSATRYDPRFEGQQFVEKPHLHHRIDQMLTKYIFEREDKGHRLRGGKGLHRTGSQDRVQKGIGRLQVHTVEQNVQQGLETFEGISSDGVAEGVFLVSQECCSVVRIGFQHTLKPLLDECLFVLSQQVFQPHCVDRSSKPGGAGLSGQRDTKLREFL